MSFHSNLILTVGRGTQHIREWSEQQQGRVRDRPASNSDSNVLKVSGGEGQIVDQCAIASPSVNGNHETWTRSETGGRLALRNFPDLNACCPNVGNHISRDLLGGR